jgi:hypothetical protein
MDKNIHPNVYKSVTILVLAVLVLFAPVFGGVSSAQAQSCQYWIAPAPAGSNSNPGTNQQPWETLEHAAAQIMSRNNTNCTVWAKDGVYNGHNSLDHRFSTMITFKAVNPYRAIVQNTGMVLEIAGASNMTFEGFEFRHAGSASSPLVVSVYDSDYIVLRNNVFHDSYDNDILKIATGSSFITVEGNVFYNQASGEQHMDVNSVSDVTIQDNIFFNDYAGRPNVDDAKHFIVIKDSNDNDDGLLGAQRIVVRRNVFMNYIGDADALVQVGNDGKPFHEAINVWFESNLIIGNNTDPAGYSFGVSGAQNVSFVNNTVTGNFPSSGYAYRIVIKDANPRNANIVFYNNIWSDPTGTMGDFSSGDPASVTGFVLDNNLYWNGGAGIPAGDVGSPTSTDAHRVVANPLLNNDQNGIVLPRWNGSSFASGSSSIREEFVRLVTQYGQVQAGSPAIDRANPLYAAVTDILGNTRGPSPDLGAFEGGGGAPAPLALDTAGVFRPSNGALYLKNSHSTGFADVQINYGIGGDYPVVGDWNGDGTATIGIYRNGSFFLRNTNTIGFADMTFPFGMPGDQPVAGDWDGDGDDTIGVYRSSTGTFFLRNSNSAGTPDMIFTLGIRGDVGIAGDWDGNGRDTTGVFRPSNGALYLKNTNATGFADIQINYGIAGDKPIVGDWNDDGKDTIGIYRNGAFYLRNNNTIGYADLVYYLGVPGDMPIAGNWDDLP